MSANIVHVGNTDIAVIAYKGQRVILSELLAQVLGTEEVRIRQNYTNNTNRFVEGKHCFKLEGEELSSFKLLSSTQHEISKHTRNLMLWTERGAARHAKFLDTDEAWDKFDLLESAYFDAKPVPTERAGITPTPLRNALVKLPNPDSVHEQCKRFLADLVALGPVDAQEARQACLTAGFSEITINRAKKALGVASRKSSDSPYAWAWAKPEGSDKLWLTVTPAELHELVEQGARAMLNRAASNPPCPPLAKGGEGCLPERGDDQDWGEVAQDGWLVGKRLAVRFERGGYITCEPVNDNDMILNSDEYKSWMEKAGYYVLKPDEYQRHMEQLGYQLVEKKLLQAMLKVGLALGQAVEAAGEGL